MNNSHRLPYNTLLIHAGVTVIANTMVIDAVQKERDNGMYQCGAENLYGVTFSSAQIRVLGEFRAVSCSSRQKSPCVSSLSPGLLQIPHKGKLCP